MEQFFIKRNHSLDNSLERPLQRLQQLSRVTVQELVQHPPPPNRDTPAEVQRPSGLAARNLQETVVLAQKKQADINFSRSIQQLIDQKDSLIQKRQLREINTNILSSSH